jgi:hypothetical protein
VWVGERDRGCGCHAVVILSQERPETMWIAYLVHKVCGQGGGGSGVLPQGVENNRKVGFAIRAAQADAPG